MGLGGAGGGGVVSRLSPQTILLFVLFVDLFAVAVVLPIIPTYATELGVQPSTIGLLGSLYGLAQLLGAPVMGSISDSYGRNVVMLISCVGTCISYLTMNFSTSPHGHPAPPPPHNTTHSAPLCCTAAPHISYFSFF